MVEERLGYTREAAKALFDALGDKEKGFLKNPTFDELNTRLERSGLFFGLYDPEPVGAVVFEGPEMHVAIKERARGKALPAVHRCIDYALARIPFVVTILHKDNREGLALMCFGFQEFRQINDWRWFVRYAI